MVTSSPAWLPRHPGLVSHPNHEIAPHLVGDCFGGMLAGGLAGGEVAVGPFLHALELRTIAVRIGNASTLIWSIIGTGVLRLSVGLADLAEADLKTDVSHALIERVA
ncbi:MAG: PLP-dependent aspartate aminotransferase family protein [Chloroflexi bacterium]|nr:PLP-dependent aspartate aminotransferase family protein [Chloroflexota bacterium]